MALIMYQKILSGIMAGLVVAWVALPFPSLKAKRLLRP
jgi:hypothetical protein